MTPNLREGPTRAAGLRASRPCCPSTPPGLGGRRRETTPFTPKNCLGAVERATTEAKDSKLLILKPLASTPRLHGARRKCGSNPILGSNSPPNGLPDSNRFCLNDLGHFVTRRRAPNLLRFRTANSRFDLLAVSAEVPGAKVPPSARDLHHREPERKSAPSNEDDRGEPPREFDHFTRGSEIAVLLCGSPFRSDPVFEGADHRFACCNRAGEQRRPHSSRTRRKWAGTAPTAAKDERQKRHRCIHFRLCFCPRPAALSNVRGESIPRGTHLRRARKRRMSQ